MCLVLSAIGSFPREIRILEDAFGVVIHDRREDVLVVSDSHSQLTFVMSDYRGCVERLHIDFFFIWSLNRKLRGFVAHLAISVELKMSHSHVPSLSSEVSMGKVTRCVQ